MLERRRPVALEPAQALARKMPGLSASEAEEWLAVEPRAWVLQHGPSLRAAGLTAKDAADLHRRLGPQVAASLSNLIDAGRMADIEIRYIHLWAASGLLKPDITGSGRRGRRISFTAWVSAARKFIIALDGDQRMAAHAAAAGLSVDETVTMRDRDELDEAALIVLTAFRESHAVVEREQQQR